MNARERVLTTLSHKQPDRVAIDIGATAATGLSIFNYHRYKESQGLSTSDIKAMDLFGLFSYIQAEDAEVVGTDILLAPALRPRFGVPIDRWKPYRFWNGSSFLVPEKMQTQKDAEGNLVLYSNGKPMGKMPVGGSSFSEIANSSMGDIRDLPDDVPDVGTQDFSDSYTEEELRFREETAKALYEGTDKAIVVDCTENIRWNASIPEWLYSMALDEEKANALHEKKSLALLKKIQQLAQATGKYAQIFAIYQDWGTQRSELVDPGMFARIVAPHYHRIFDWIHANTQWKVFFHSCGSIFHLIPHMIDMGVDILNPVQCDAAGMEPGKLKETYGDRLVFWGGGVDAQSCLKYGTPEEVSAQIKKRISILNEGGGYIFAPTQSIQTDVPLPNLIAMMETLKEVRI